MDRNTPSGYAPFSRKGLLAQVVDKLEYKQQGNADRIDGLANRISVVESRVDENDDSIEGFDEEFCRLGKISQLEDKIEDLKKTILWLVDLYDDRIAVLAAQHGQTLLGAYVDVDRRLRHV